MRAWIQCLNLIRTLIMTYLSKMAKKIVKIVNTHTHKQCKHCVEVDYEFISCSGKPIMGECIYSETRFLLNEKTDCKEYGNK